MNCRDTLLMLSGYMDGEIDLVHRLEIERHLETCEECANNLNNARAIQTIVRSKPLYSPAPSGLQSRVLTAVRAAERAQRPLSRPFVRPLLGIAAAACLALLLWVVAAQRAVANREAQVIQQVTCSHVRSMMANHLLDITSADPHVVQPWFSGKLDYSPPVTDLKAQGYTLQGGRLDYINDRSVAALVYRRQKHVINLFLWPVPESETCADRVETHQGYSLYRWTRAGMMFCAVSDMRAVELKGFSVAMAMHTNLFGLPDCK